MERHRHDSEEKSVSVWLVEGDGSVTTLYEAEAPTLWELRRDVHLAMDPIWQRGPLRRHELYRYLAHYLGLKLLDCHVSLMDRQQCAAALLAVELIRRRSVARTDEECLVWADHPCMRPMLVAEVVTYWTTMPRPMTVRQAEARIALLRREGKLLTVEGWLR